MRADIKGFMRIKRSVGVYTTKPTHTYYEQASDRLIFRALTVEDIALWTPFFDRDDYMHFLGQDVNTPGSERSKAWIERQIQRKEENDYGQLAIIEKSSNEFIGVGGIIERDIAGVQEYEITYSLMPSSWGKGYARELAKHFINFAHNAIETKSVISLIHPENQASISVALANGLKLDGEAVFMGIPVEIYRFIFPDQREI